MPEAQSRAENGSPQIPEWLTEEYLRSILQSYTQDKILQINSLKFTPGVMKGEAYASVMLRIFIEYYSSLQEEVISARYLVKSPFEGNDVVQESFSEYQIYAREMDMYEQFLPQMKQLLKKAGISDHFFPDTLHIDRANKAIIFEDLSIHGYKCGNHIQGLDLVHAKLAFEVLARMHAASAKLNELCPNIFKSCDRGLFNRHTKAYDPFYIDMMQHLITVVQKWDHSKYYVRKLQKLQSIFLEHARRSFDVNDKFLNVLGHGDVWTNNIMFKHNDKNEPIDVVLIDFQYSSYTSPSNDINYFLTTSLNDEIRLSCRDELIEHYYRHLADYLRKLDFKTAIPSYPEFLHQINAKSFYGCFGGGCMVQPLFHNEHTEDADFDSLLGSDQRACNFRRRLYSSDRTKKNLQKFIAFLDKQGLLDLE